ncbi:MAG TPA: hypothetical protein DCG75_06550 [Bacteroidales bacterium]|nr:hypothetical protein [Bacteroidales bacterium]
MMKDKVKTITDNTMKDNWKKHNTEKISFLSHISHGIRTPLNSIMGFSKLLTLRDLVDKKQKEYVQGILNGSNLLLQFVDNVMDLSQFEANNYSLRIKDCDINQVIWEFTEDFYNQKIENRDTNINLVLVWESDVKDLVVETDALLLKKALQRIVNLVSTKYPISEFELGYRILENKSLCIYVRPAKEKLTEEDLLIDQQFYSIDDYNSFEYFNYKVLYSAVLMLRGELTLNSENQEFSFIIPTKYDMNNILI